MRDAGGGRGPAPLGLLLVLHGEAEAVASSQLADPIDRDDAQLDELDTEQSAHARHLAQPPLCGPFGACTFGRPSLLQSNIGNYLPPIVPRQLWLYLSYPTTVIRHAFIVACLDLAGPRAALLAEVRSRGRTGKYLLCQSITGRARWEIPERSVGAYHLLTLAPHRPPPPVLPAVRSPRMTKGAIASARMWWQRAHLIAFGLFRPFVERIAGQARLLELARVMGRPNVTNHSS